MSEVVVELSADEVEELIDSINRGLVWEFGPDGEPVYFLTEETVAQVGGLKIEVFANEHPPPHFRVRFQGSTANFTIRDCSRLNGSGEVLRYEKNILHWWRGNKETLIRVWNERRPADCVVGLYRE